MHRPTVVILGSLLVSFQPCKSQTLYEFGNPKAEEQLYIELINRARQNPGQEGARLAGTTDPQVLSAYSQYGVNLTMMQNEFNAILAAPPLAPHASLMTAARGHSDWMLANAVQTHYQNLAPNIEPWDRMQAAGYDWWEAGENVYARAKSVWHAHAGFQVDWGTGGTGGMQSPRGHRDSIHNPLFREIGVGVTFGTNGTVGPQLVTQDFGSQDEADFELFGPNFGTGVAYYDLNSNSFYDVGEGISGLTVNLTGATQFCKTAIGGGWVVPVSNAAATRTVTFSGLNVNQSSSLVFPASKNAKADLKLTYNPPSITSPANALAGNSHNLSFTPVGGATGYKWSRWNPASALPENCESTATITSSTTGTYQILNTTVKQQGSSSFHLENSTGASQWLQLNALYFGGASPSLSFQSQLRASTTSERFKVQVREEGSVVWQDVYSQTGYGNGGEATFNLKTSILTGMSGKAFRVRFLLDFVGTGYYPTSGPSYGWFIDAINFTEVSGLSGGIIQDLTSTSGSASHSAGTYVMSVAPVISERPFPAAYQTLTVSAPVPTFLTWAAGIETAQGLPAGSIANGTSDYDKDGRANLVEYAFGASPVIANDAAPRLPTVQPSSTHLVLRYQRDTALADISLTAEAGTGLDQWKSPGQSGAPAGFTDSLVSTAGTLETREAKLPRSSAPGCFLRIRVTRP